MIKRKPNAAPISRVAPAPDFISGKTSTRNRSKLPCWQSSTGHRVLPAEAAHCRAYTAIKDAVLAGKFGPGEIVTLRSLTKQMAMGDTPVRDALRRLTSEGAFEALPNRSARVPELNRRQVEQLLELRVHLEGKAAADAARNITLAQIEGLRHVQGEIESGIDKGDSSAVAALNMAFHFEIYRIADNPFLISVIQTLWLRMAVLIARSVTLMTRHSEKFGRVVIENHERLLAALQARDAAGAEEAMRRALLAFTNKSGYWECLEIASG